MRKSDPMAARGKLVSESVPMNAEIRLNEKNLAPPFSANAEPASIEACALLVSDVAPP